MSALRTGPMKWPQRWVAAYVVTLPAGEGKEMSATVSEMLSCIPKLNLKSTCNRVSINARKPPLITFYRKKRK